MSGEILLLAALGALGWYWYAGLQVREQAVAVGRRACRDAGVQFLDDSVALGRIRLARNGDGQLQFRRDYRFEFSDTGDNRRPGVVRMLGDHAEWVSLDRDWQPGALAGVTRLRD
ncbi:DUF3301 domain-containing protein [Thiobacillus sedimenti]|uniref:DUF3301 domain-containing protein n=1 Tax=Thiobacillus sedimenti TaxID=3110231 RepID=A0ABZ1CG16_9PROT|nr:DUF3301 domain-containing protein [Thiobacillus sp. SCUT-2]WRS37930.1 DUF3301 domain-containing protein [Thiobacillus sp. SCUT-2]